jgi:hypothetical protein
MSDDSPTLGEVVRRLDDAVRELREMRREIAEDRSRFEARFLPRAEFDLSQATDAIQMSGLERETHSVGKRLDAVEIKSDEKIAEVAKGLKEIEQRRRSERMWLIGAVVMPSVLLLLNALLTARAL